LTCEQSAWPLSSHLHAPLGNDRLSRKHRHLQRPISKKGAKTSKNPVSATFIMQQPQSKRKGSIRIIVHMLPRKEYEKKHHLTKNVQWRICSLLAISTDLVDHFERIITYRFFAPVYIYIWPKKPINT